MSIRKGRLFIDRRASIGKIPEEKIYELGNYQSVGTVKDIPELTFDLWEPIGNLPANWIKVGV